MFICRSLPRIYIRHYSSALYITGDKASSNFVVLTPYLDFEERLENKEKLQENIKLRGKAIDLDKFEKYWNFYKHLYNKLFILNDTKKSINEILSDLQKEPEKNNEEIEKLKLHAKTAKDNYRNLRDYMYPVEESAALNALSLPNILDERTPHSEPRILHSFLDKPLEKSNHHFHLATTKTLFHYLNPTFWFLQNEAAIFEHAVINYGYNTLLSNGFLPTVNGSFNRSIVLEGCCMDYLNLNNIFTVYEEESKHSISKLHFVGNSSIYSFVGYFAKFSIQLGYFPVKFFSYGKQYQPVVSNEKSLLNLSQYSVLNTFVITKDDEQDDEIFDALIKIVREFYDSLGYHYQLVYVPANKLEDYESLRLSIQMYSSCSQTYVEVGNLSLCRNYLSKRLLISYNEDAVRKYANIIHGTFINIQKLLACILEYNDLNNGELLSSQLKKSFQCETCIDSKK